jgi:hypothetical protein
VNQKVRMKTLEGKLHLHKCVDFSAFTIRQSKITLT